MGCAEQPQAGTSTIGSKLMADYTGLVEDAKAWTYRNQGWNYDDPDILLETTLLPARHIGDGVVQLRRGVSWTDSNDHGVFYFDTTDGGLALTKWSLPGNNGEGWYPFVGEEIVVGEVVEGDWSCEASLNRQTVLRPSMPPMNLSLCLTVRGESRRRVGLCQRVGTCSVSLPDASSGLELVAPW